MVFRRSYVDGVNINSKRLKLIFLFWFIAFSLVLSFSLPITAAGSFIVKEKGQYYDDSGVAKGILVDEDYIYVADGDDGLEILEYDFDSDEDGLSDEEETTLGDDGYLTDTDDPDSDDDGYTDKEEAEAGTDPNDPADYPTEAAGLTTGALLILGILSLFGVLFVSTKRKK
ncbi:MAG: hypothetical protein FK730_11335 [Asgard group archaeon]|nr:hypothetical protein [Asgard group archaeon]